MLQKVVQTSFFFKKCCSSNVTLNINDRNKTDAKLYLLINRWLFIYKNALQQGKSSTALLFNICYFEWYMAAMKQMQNFNILSIKKI